MWIVRFFCQLAQIKMPSLSHNLCPHCYLSYWGFASSLVANWPEKLSHNLSPPPLSAVTHSANFSPVCRFRAQKIAQRLCDTGSHRINKIRLIVWVSFQVFLSYPMLLPQKQKATTTAEVGQDMTLMQCISLELTFPKRAENFLTTDIFAYRDTLGNQSKVSLLANGLYCVTVTNWI